MKKLIGAAAFMLLTAFAVSANASDIELLVEVDKTAYLHNTTGADISFDGYQIVSEGGVLDVAGWDSIADRFPARLTELLDTLGAGSVAFGELNPSANQVAEGNLTGVGVLKAGAKFSLGKPFGSALPDVVNDQFFFKIGGVPTQVTGNITVVPEPSSLVLGGMGLVGLAGLIRRRRAA